MLNSNYRQICSKLKYFKQNFSLLNHGDIETCHKLQVKSMAGKCLSAAAAPLVAVYFAHSDSIPAAIIIGDKINFYITDLGDILVEFGVDVGIDTVGTEFFKTICRLIQSHSQRWTASAGPHKIEDQVFAGVGLVFENLFKFRSRSFANIQHKNSPYIQQNIYT